MNLTQFIGDLSRLLRDWNRVPEREVRAVYHAHVAQNTKITLEEFSYVMVNFAGDAPESARLYLSQLLACRNLEITNPDWHRIARLVRFVTEDDEHQSWMFGYIFHAISKSCRNVAGLDPAGLPPHLNELIGGFGPITQKKWRDMLNPPPKTRSGLLPDHTVPDTPCDADAEDACILCFVNEAAVALVPCGHMQLCIACTRGLEKKECPTCRATISKVVKIFK